MCSQIRTVFVAFYSFFLFIWKYICSTYHGLGKELILQRHKRKKLTQALFSELIKYVEIQGHICEIKMKNENKSTMTPKQY